MKVSNLYKIIFDLIMLAVLLIAYSVHSTGATIHEFIGLAVFIFFIVHLAYNHKWIANVSKRLFDKSLGIRVKIMYAADFLLLVSFILTGLSGIMTSRVIFTFEKTYSTNLIWSPVHSLSAAGSLILIAIHLALHFDMILNTIKTKIPFAAIKISSIILFVIFLSGGIYGEIATIQDLQKPTRQGPNYSTIVTLIFRTMNYLNGPSTPEMGLAASRKDMPEREGMMRREGMARGEGIQGREGMARGESMPGREGMARGNGIAGREVIPGSDRDGVRGVSHQNTINFFNLWISISNMFSVIILCSIITVLIDKKIRKRNKQ